MAEKIAFFDSNILIAASLSNHIHHTASFKCLASLRNGVGACASHSFAEAYNTLTRPNGYQLYPAHAAQIIEEAGQAFKVVTLTPKETIHTITQSAALGLAGPIIYDALLMACARKVDATWIYTFNVKHFIRVAPDLAKRIVEP